MPMWRALLKVSYLKVLLSDIVWDILPVKDWFDKLHQVRVDQHFNLSFSCPWLGPEVNDSIICMNKLMLLDDDMIIELEERHF